MIIVDLNQVMISNIMASLGPGNLGAVDENMIRHMVLNALRGFNTKFKSEYGQMVIACDNTNNWRKSLFPYYKASRKKDRDESSLDWNSIFEAMGKIRSELKEFFPYRVVDVYQAEADDVIGTLVTRFATLGEPILIISGDKDFRQLHRFLGVKQYDPVKKAYIVENNPEGYLKEHIIRGDRSDGIPNIMSADDSIVLGVRQASLTAKRLEKFLSDEPSNYELQTHTRNFSRNEMLIDLSKIPSEIQEKILEEYESQAGKNKDRLLTYFIAHRLKNLMEHLPDF